MSNPTTVDKEQVLNKNPLVGQWFLSSDSEEGEIHRHGEVVGYLGNGYYYIECWSWGPFEEPIVRRIVHIGSMLHWMFYRNSEDLSLAETYPNIKKRMS